MEADSTRPLRLMYSADGNCLFCKDLSVLRIYNFIIIFSQRVLETHLTVDGEGG